ncbi:RNA recognition motif domain containing protein [Babesia bovis T2Bo]|uniref:RRM domain-containing protein n=1 Tax=Babesia bovis TaxID=5865 RepID=A7AM85_BABBO|nr:RNA recognition motif domain containing protein [Babesia bovis T2Bo]EDO07669.1 RNA recognition motif domain containing protein [Babesia bovis T2Bo]|eukprot:XP_001611237.1 hypothetical protein [Babesia bovis T2Bo]
MHCLYSIYPVDTLVFHRGVSNLGYHDGVINFPNSRYVDGFISISYPVRNGCRPLFGVSTFPFDPSLVKKRRSRPRVDHVSRARRKLESDHSAMHGLATLGTQGSTSEDQRAASLIEFISRIEAKPRRKRLPLPSDPGDPSYDALLYLKGLPYDCVESDILDWLSSYSIVDVILIKNEEGCFTGDAYVRCSTLSERDRVHREMSGKYLGLRYIPIYRLTESAYMEYYHVGYRREPAKRNHIHPRYVVAKQGVEIVSTDISVLKTGSRVCGVVNEIYRNGLLLDCGIYELVDGYRERVFCVLLRNRLARNVGLSGQHREWLRDKDLVLFPGIKLNLYVEKIRYTSARTSFDGDLWREHLGEPFESVDRSGSTSLRSMVYLTMDSSVSDDKVAWWERRLFDSYAKFTLIDAGSKRDKVAVVAPKVNPVVGSIAEPVKLDHETLDHVSFSTSWLDPLPKVDRAKVVVGKVAVMGDWNMHYTSRFALEEMEGTDPSPEPDIPYNQLVNEFLRGSVVDRHGTHYHGFGDNEPPLEFALKSVRGSPPEIKSPVSSRAPSVKPDTAMAPPVSEQVNAPEPPTEDTYTVESDTTLDKSDALLGNLNPLEDVRRRTVEESFTIFPRQTLFDECIKIPGTDWLLRRCDVPKLAPHHVISLLHRFDVSEDTSANADYANRVLLCDIIRDRGLGTGLDARTLIEKGVYKLNQSKKKLKRIIELMKHLTGRKFTRDDLDTASKSELHMLAEEALRYFLRWEPDMAVKKSFVDMYGGDIDSNLDLDARWDSLKWTIVIRIYGEQSDLKSIMRDIEANNRAFGVAPGRATSDFGTIVQHSLSKEFGSPRSSAK